MRDVPTAKRDGARGWADSPGYQFEERALAGTIRPNQAMELALFKNEIQLIDSRHATKMFGQRFDFQEPTHVSLRPPIGHRQGVPAP